MNCPVCEATRMREVEKDGILIDICPTCKGVWLDRGELDKLMQGVQEARQDYNQWYYSDDDDDRKRRYPPRQPHYDDKQAGHGHYPHKKKKKSVMDVFGDLFGGD